MSEKTKQRESRVTGWYPRTVRPVRPGVYETCEPDGSMWFNYFDGLCWHYGGAELDFFGEDSYMFDQPMNAKAEASFVAVWRGLRASAIRREAAPK